MIKYAKYIDEEIGTVNVGLGENSEFYQSIGYIEMDVEKSEIDNQYYISEKCPHYTEEEKKQKERELLNKLNVTRGDVFEALIRARGIEQTDIEQLISFLPVPELDKKIYQSRLANALNFYREFPLFDILGITLDPQITPQMWDNYFVKATDEETKANAWQELASVINENDIND